LHIHSLEFFGPDHGHEQINEKAESDDADNECFHKKVLESVAEQHVKRAQNKEGDGYCDEDQIIHDS